MFKLSDNYYYRQCYFEREDVPTQSIMKKTMSPPLAQVYFKSMIPQLKVLAGLEPPLKGGGSEWYIPPKDLLKGRVVMRPVKKEHITKLGSSGIIFLGEVIVDEHKRTMEEEKLQTLLENDIFWKETIEVCCRKQWDDLSIKAAARNTEKIKLAFQQFTSMYATSITKIQDLMFDATIQQIKKVREDAFKEMQIRYERFLKQQATTLYDKYKARLAAEQARLKAGFIEDLEMCRTEMGNRLHDIHYEKHVAIEKLRNLLECQNLACQVYVALKEREECKKEIELSEHIHKKHVRTLAAEIAMKDIEILLAQEKERKHQEFNTIWQKKVCEVVKKFQMFVAYSLNTLPEQAEFFINMEKLMMLQLNDVLENPHVESIFIPEHTEGFHTPIPRPHPFFLFCDKGYKPQLDQKLCPKHCTSSASQLPVIVVNKRCIYAACDNFDMFTDKIAQYVQGQRGDEHDADDDHDYKHDIQIKVTASKEIEELKLKSSVCQVLQGEVPNIRDVPIECCVCKIPYCFCSPTNATKMSSPLVIENRKSQSLVSISSGQKIETRRQELFHEREPKWDSYINYVTSKKCKCAKMAKKHLEEHLPPYMRKMSKFDAPDLPLYEPCSVRGLKKAVKKALGKPPPPPAPEPLPPRTRTVSVQCIEPEYDMLCTCFSDNEIEKIFKNFLKDSKIFDNEEARAQCSLVTGTISPSHLTRNTDSFATDRAESLKRLLDASPQLEEIFRKEDCRDYDQPGMSNSFDRYPPCSFR